jgi:hypothetical protein
MWQPRLRRADTLSLVGLVFLALAFSGEIAHAQGQPALVTGVDRKTVGLVDLDQNLNPEPAVEHKREVEIETAKKCSTEFRREATFSS